MDRLAPLSLLIAAWLGPAVAETATSPVCAAAGQATIAVSFRGSDWHGATPDTVLADLRALLKTQGFAVCPARELGRHRPTASVEIQARPTAPVGLSIRIRDSVTQKLMGRRLSLTEFPADSRSLAIAVATDELLRASWIELSLVGAQHRRERAPPAVRRVVEREIQRVRRPHMGSLGLRWVLEGYTRGHLQHGVDAYYERLVWRRLGIQVSTGFRLGVPTHSENGTLTSQAWVGALLATVSLWQSDRYRWMIGAGGQLANLWLRGEANPGARGQSSSLLALSARLGTGGRVRLFDRIACEVSAFVGAPVAGVGARDMGTEISAVAGVEYAVSVGLTWGY